MDETVKVPPKFNISQRVKRIEDREIVGAVILEVQECDESYVYHIQYDEHLTSENKSGWWSEDSLTSETIADIKARLGVN